MFPVIVIILRLLHYARHRKCVSKERKAKDLYLSVSNLITSRRCQDENGKEMYPNVKRTSGACRTTVLRPIFLNPTNNVFAFWHIIVAVPVVFSYTGEFKNANDGNGNDKAKKQ